VLHQHVTSTIIIISSSSIIITVIIILVQMTELHTAKTTDPQIVKKPPVESPWFFGSALFITALTSTLMRAI